MTVTVVLSDCPPKLRGDMTKWFIEINTGVYVGNMSARVRDEIWDRIVENLGHGHATMIYSTSSEQHLDFRVHNAYWQPIDYDGIKLIRRPERNCHFEKNGSLKLGFSRSSKHHMAEAKRKLPKALELFRTSDYVILDLETTGVDETKDEIIEIGALFVIQDKIVESKQIFVKCDTPLPEEIVRLTGITDDDLKREGVPLESALQDLIDFIEDVPIVSHNAHFEKKFLSIACRRTGERKIENRYIDTLEMSMILLPNIRDHKLITIADYFDVACPIHHRALPDCETAFAVYGKLKELAFPEEEKGRKSE